MACALMLTGLFNVNANKDLLEMAKHVMVGYKLTTSSSWHHRVVLLELRSIVIKLLIQ